MAKILADVENKIDVLDETEEASRGRGWKLWVFAPIVLAVVAGGAFMVVRRVLGNSEN